MTSSLTNITLNCPTLSAAQLSTLVTFNRKREYAITLSNFLNGLASGVNQATLTTSVGAVSAVGKVVLAGEPTASDTFSVGNVTFTAETSGATGNQFNIGTSVTQTASNIVSAVNASTDSNATVVATSTAGTVVLTAVMPGASGNGIQLSSALTNGTSGLVPFAGGTNGSTFVTSLG